MSEIQTIKVGDVSYNVLQASAIKQKTLMSLVGARVSLNSAASQTAKIDSNMIYGLLLSLSEKDLNEVSDILLHKTSIHGGGEKLITVDDFQNNIHAYFTLLAEALVLNLKDFFTWLDAENAKQRLENQGGNS